MKEFHPEIKQFTTVNTEKAQHIAAAQGFLQSAYTVGTWELNDKLEANRFRDNIGAWAKAQGYWIVNEDNKVVEKHVIDVATKTIDEVVYGQLVKIQEQAEA